MSSGKPPAGGRAGLCEDCLHQRIVVNRRGSRFYLCERSKDDARFPRYPPLPVLSCRGYEKSPPDPWADYEEEDDR